MRQSYQAILNKSCKDYMFSLICATQILHYHIKSIQNESGREIVQGNNGDKQETERHSHIIYICMKKNLLSKGIIFQWVLFYFVLVLTGTCYVPEIGLELRILLPQPLESLGLQAPLSSALRKVLSQTPHEEVEYIVEIQCMQ